MKLKLILPLLVLSIPCLAQNKLMDVLPLKDGIVTYSGIVEIDSISKSELYARAKKWFALTYKSAKDVIQLDDKENGEIIGKGVSSISYFARDPTISHTLTISVKDGKYRYIITNLTYADIQGEKFNIERFPKSWAGEKRLYVAVDKEINSIIISIATAMRQEAKKDDW